jgi:hypothetical protein
VCEGYLGKEREFIGLIQFTSESNMVCRWQGWEASAEYSLGEILGKKFWCEFQTEIGQTTCYCTAGLLWAPCNHTPAAGSTQPQSSSKHHGTIDQQ